MNNRNTPPICNYENSDYQSSFWEKGGREYEDRVEAIALKRLLPKSGHLLLELGAGAGRNTLRYTGFDRIVLLDFSRTQLELAQQRLGRSDKYVYIAADVYRLPFIDDLFDAATMIRVLHHMADAPQALGQVRNTLRPEGTFILEYANKLNLKAILRYWFRRQAWSPFTPEPVEFEKLNFDFHPQTVRKWLLALGFEIEKILNVSHFRIELLKQAVPTSMLVFFDSLFQWTGAFFQWTPSVFVLARIREKGSLNKEIPAILAGYFKCPECGHTPLDEKKSFLFCPDCHRHWEIKDGIYDFREPVS